MARITVEDCLTKIDNQYDLVLLAKERTAQLNSGSPMLVEEDNDKRTIISLREIGDGKVLVKDLEKSAILRLRKEPDESLQKEEAEEEENDEFENLYKGQISKSGVAILPSKRSRRIPEVKKPSLADEAISELKAEQPEIKEETLDKEEAPLEESLDTKKEPIRLTWIVWEKNSTGMGFSLPRALPAPTTPAQLTAKVIPSIKSLASFTALWISFSEVTLVFINKARSPNRLAFALPCSEFRSIKTAIPPELIILSAVLSPRPDAPPDIIAFEFVIFMI